MPHHPCMRAAHVCPAFAGARGITLTSKKGPFPVPAQSASVVRPSIPGPRRPLILRPPVSRLGPRDWAVAEAGRHRWFGSRALWGYLMTLANLHAKFPLYPQLRMVSRLGSSKLRQVPSRNSPHPPALIDYLAVYCNSTVTKRQPLLYTCLSCYTGFWRPRCHGVETVLLSFCIRQFRAVQTPHASETD